MTKKIQGSEKHGTGKNHRAADAGSGTSAGGSLTAGFPHGIVGYAKTRDTYVAYRKAGYSKNFLAEHESEITIHKAAKNYFDGLGFKKLPTIKALNTEYAELLAEKKAAYADYRKAREEMKELLTAKANIDRILELDKEQGEANERREKEAEQR